jgi:thioredoxin-dependent peroxiredoxin
MGPVLLGRAFDKISKSVSNTVIIMSEVKTKLEIGDTAPNFVSINQKEEKICLYDLLNQGKKVLLVFYPRDFTPGCTKQLCGIRDIYSEYEKLGVTILGVNPADSQSHADFIEHHKYQFDILVDKEKEIINSFGVMGSLYGRPHIKRGVFLIGPDKKILYRFWGQQDNEKIIELLKNLN